MTAAQFLVYEAPTPDHEINFIDGLWLTDEAVDVIVHHPHFHETHKGPNSEYGRSLLNNKDYGDTDGARLVVWLGSHSDRICFDARVVRPDPTIIPFTEGVHCDSYIEDHKYVYVHKPCRLYSALQLLSRTEGNKTGKQRYEDMRRITAFAVIASHFLPALMYEDALYERFSTSQARRDLRRAG